MPTKEELLAAAEMMKQKAAELESAAAALDAAYDPNARRTGVTPLIGGANSEFERQFNAMPLPGVTPETAEERYKRIYREVTHREMTGDFEKDTYGLTRDEFFAIYDRL